MPDERLDRPDPEELLRRIEREERAQRRGRLKIFLGYASGVGKSFQLVDEARRRRERGEDVVVGATQPEYDTEVECLLAKAEVLSPRVIDGVETLDVAAILARRPQVVVIDGLAYDNPPGSRNRERWLDVKDVLDAGISVITSVNLQYIEELKPEVEAITGRRARQGIPRAFLNSADEIVVVDAPALSALARTAAERGGTGNVREEEEKLSRLREMTLLVAADVVDRQLEAYLEAHGIEATWGTQERILVCVTPKSNAAAMIASGRRNADRFHGELFVANVRQPVLSQSDKSVLETNLAYAREMGAEVVMLEGLDPLDAILGFARQKNITQIFIGHSLGEGAWRRLWRSFVNRLIRSAEGIDISIFPH
jgi:two-component system sensor histidine kinase KdpD